MGNGARAMPFQMDLLSLERPVLEQHEVVAGDTACRLVRGRLGFHSYEPLSGQH